MMRNYFSKFDLILTFISLQFIHVKPSVLHVHLTSKMIRKRNDLMFHREIFFNIRSSNKENEKIFFLKKNREKKTLYFYSLILTYYYYETLIVN